MKHVRFPLYGLPVLLSTLFFLALSCSPDGKSVVGGNNATGKPCEILLVMDADYLRSDAGQQVKDALQAPLIAMPQVEPSLDVQTVADKDFDSFLRFVRNILIVEIDPERFTSNGLKYTYDRWASGQIVATLRAPSIDSLAIFLEQQGSTINNLFFRSELYNIASTYTSGYSASADQYAMEIFNKHISIPADIKSYKKGEQFLWMSSNTMRRRKDLLLYTLPYYGQNLTGNYLRSCRDSVLAIHLPGGIEGSHSGTAPYGLQMRTISLPHGEEIKELRGLWEMKGGGAMGGPFVQHARIVPEENKIYIVEGFVYHPNELKRNLLLEMEAALFSFRSGDEKEWSPDFIRAVRWSPYQPVDTPLPSSSK